jgi:hypothetical protein
MSEQKAVTFLPSDETDQEPLRLEEMLTLVKLAYELGYSIKVAKEMKNLYDARSTDLFSVWFAIENELPIFVSNIPDLIEFTGWERYKSSLMADDINKTSAS